jgi:hypothetical protein
MRQQHSVRRRVAASSPISSFKEISSMLHVLNAIKLLHWSTKSFATHKASDELHAKLSELVDQYVEILLKDTIPPLRLSANFPSPLTSSNSMKAIQHFMTELKKMRHGGDDLQNIRDEMLATLNQFAYLVRLN